MKTSFQELLKKLAARKYPSQRQFAEAAGVHRATLNRYFSQNGEISSDNFIKILAALDIHLEQILERELRLKSTENALTDPSENDDLLLLINSLPTAHRKNLISRAINLIKLRENARVAQAIERFEKK